MDLFDSRYTPWTECKPTGVECGCYFLGTFNCPNKGKRDMWVTKNMSQYSGLRSASGSWTVSNPFSLTREDRSYACFAFMNELVLNCWWEIVTSAPYYP